jgi:hypothetical protein
VCKKLTGIGSERLGNANACHCDHKHDETDDEGDIGGPSLSHHALLKGVAAHGKTVDGSLVPLQFTIELLLTARVALGVPCQGYVCFGSKHNIKFC